MQLDLLQGETIPDEHKTDTVELPPLPESLRPPFTAAIGDDDSKAPGAFKSISEAAKILSVPQHVLRFWESRFPQIKPLKMRGGRRYYRPEDMKILITIKHLLYKQGYTIKGARKAFGLASHTEQTEDISAIPAKSHSGELTDRQYSQLAVIRQELLSLRDAIKQHM